MTKSEAMYWWRRSKAKKASAEEKSAMRAVRALDRKEQRYRKSGQGAFENSFASYDAIADASFDPSKMALLSDCGRWARIIRGYGNDPLGEALKRIDAARNRIKRRDPTLLQVFYLVLKNGTDREKSICELMESTKQGGKPSKRGLLDASKKS